MLGIIVPPQPAIPEVSPLHIPDGFLSAPVAIAGYVLTAAFVALAISRTNKQMGDKAAPLMGVLAAFIFAGQMINFPIAGGTSGHLVGGALAAILIGPWAAIITMAAVVAVQALIFQDGGLGALGANIFNIGIVTVLVGYAIYMAGASVFRNRPAVRLGAAFVAGWVTVMVSAGLTAGQLAISGTSTLAVALPAMLGIHAIMGVAEGVITAAAVALVLSARPDLVEGPKPPPSPRLSTEAS
jgi:cobalt/nickel transport system permease protein